MRGSWINRHGVLVAAVGASLAASMMPVRWAGAVSHYPRHIVEAILSPSVRGLKAVSDAIVRPADLEVQLGGVGELRANLEQALQYNERLRQELAEARQQVAQLSRVRQRMRLEGAELVWAAVTSWSGDRRYPLLMLNRGSEVGIRQRYVVASGFNLVGRVVNVGPVTAAVRLVTAPKTHMAVRLVPPVAGEPMRATLAQAFSVEDGDGFLAVIDAADPVEVGDLAHLADDGWPREARGLVVGKVVGIGSDPDDPTLRRRVVIAPIRALAHLDRVVVILPVEPEQRPSGLGGS